MERFDVTYRIVADDRADAESRTANIALEDTVEIPRDVVPTGYVEDVILGRVEDVSAGARASSLGRVSITSTLSGHELPQLPERRFRERSIQQGVKAIGLTPNADLRARFPGARFGAARAAADDRAGPMGLRLPRHQAAGIAVARLAELCHAVARAGADIVKEDHGLANQDAAPFRARVTAAPPPWHGPTRTPRGGGDATRALFRQHRRAWRPGPRAGDARAGGGGAWGAGIPGLLRVRRDQPPGAGRLISPADHGASVASGPLRAVARSPATRMG